MTNTPAHYDRAAWENSSQYWDKYQATIEKMFAPLTHALIADAEIQPGQAVLDIGGGSGEPSLTIAPIVGPTGSVTYTDPAAGMVETARRESERRGLTNITFRELSAERLEFPDNTFDVVVARLSAMFFENPQSAIGEILRVAKPRGRVTLAVWGGPEANPFFTVVSKVLNRFVPAPSESEDAPGAFRFAQQGKLASLLRNAGLTSIVERQFSFNIEYPIDVEKFWELRTEMSDSFRGKLAQLSTDKLSEVKATAITELAQYFVTGTMNFPAQVWIVSAEK